MFRLRLKQYLVLYYYEYSMSVVKAMAILASTQYQCQSAVFIHTGHFLPVDPVDSVVTYMHIHTYMHCDPDSTPACSFLLPTATVNLAVL